MNKLILPNKRARTMWGTSFFRSKFAAIRYYRHQYPTFAVTVHAVERKIKEELISIGIPSVKPGEEAVLNESEGRYFILAPNKN